VTQSRDVINWTGGAIAVGVMSIVAFVVVALVLWTIPPENENPLMFMLGQLTGMMTMIVAFYFGSSSKEKKLADTVDTQAKTMQTAGVALATNNGPAALVIPPGESATATSTEGGTVIKPEAAP
jgi:hypothetical protein